MEDLDIKYKMTVPMSSDVIILQLDKDLALLRSVAAQFEDAISPALRSLLATCDMMPVSDIGPDDIEMYLEMGFRRKKKSEDNGSVKD